jgi:hypothetical protein
MVKNTRKRKRNIKKRNNKSKRYFLKQKRGGANISSQMVSNASQMGDHISSQSMRPNVANISSQMVPNASQMGDHISSQNMRPNATNIRAQVDTQWQQMGDQLVSQITPELKAQGTELYNQATGILSDVVVPAYKDIYSTFLDTAKQLAKKEYDTRIEQLKILNQSGRKLLNVSENIQQKAEKTGKVMENMVDTLQQVQTGGKHIIKRVYDSKNQFFFTDLPLTELSIEAL